MKGDLSMREKTTVSTSMYDIDGKPPLRQAIPLALQHVLAMFAGNVAVPIIVAGAIGATADERAYLIQCAMLVAGIATLIQVIRFGPVGAKLPIVMGTSFGFLSASIAIGNQFGIGAIFGAALVGGFFEMILGFFLKYIRKYFPPIVTGTVLLTIGLSLLPTGINYFAGGAGAADFGSWKNIFLGSVVLITIIICSQFTKGFAKTSAILIGIVVGYLVAIPLGKVNFAQVTQSAWFSIPMPFKYGISFHWQPILTMIVMYIITAIETVGDISGVTVGGAGREATDEELSGGVIADGLGSVIAAIFNALPNTSFSQNVGLVAVTKVMSNYVVKIGALFLVLGGLLPKFGGIIAAMPSSVLGGATIVMFGSITLMGMKLITTNGLSNRDITIVSIALCMGYGLSLVPDAMAIFPSSVQMFFGGAGIVVSCGIALLLNILLPKTEENGSVNLSAE
jgi:NCS2 family nucleobase:cation symporter-2